MREELEELKANAIAFRKEIKQKFQLPIIITYSIVLIIYNWDILYYLSFEKKAAIYKIKYVKSFFFTENAERIWKPILLALFYSILFPFIQVVINQVVQYFKRANNKITRKEELDNAIHNFNVQQQLSGQQSLQQLQNKIDQLVIEKEQLISTNNSLLGQLKNDSNDAINSTQIFDSQFDKISKKMLEDVNKLTDEEKSTFVETITYLEKITESFTINNLKARTVFPSHIPNSFEILKRYKLVENITNSTEYYKVNQLGLKVLPYFKSKYVR